MTVPLEDILTAQEAVLEPLNHEQRVRVLDSSVTLYERDGRQDVAEAIRKRRAREATMCPNRAASVGPVAVECPHGFDSCPTCDGCSHKEPVSLAAERVARKTPDTLVAFMPLVSFEGRGGCSAEACPDFVLGWEAGQLSARLDARPEEWSGTYHAANSIMLERIAAARRYSVETAPSGDPLWVFATFRPLPRLSLVTDGE